MSRADPSPLRRAVRRLNWALGIPDLLYRLQERRVAASAPAGPTAVDGLAVPPALLRVLVAGYPSAEEFLTRGRDDAEEFAAIFAAHGGALAEASILDIGCGCGRIARWILARGGAKITGVDINRRLINWCRRELPGRWVATTLGAPLPFSPGAFDLAYACSVATHLREQTVSPWLADLARVLAPGGLLIVTFHDEVHPTLAHPEAAGAAEALAAKGYAVLVDRMEGSNRLAAYATMARLEALAAPSLKLVEYRPSTTTRCGQAIALFRRP